MADREVTHEDVRRAEQSGVIRVVQVIYEKGRMRYQAVVKKTGKPRTLTIRKEES